ncbi:DUF6088 family protein [Epilithonimonas ginsengisoli]|uniref:DUF6088 family protein n=1 Tax=Epilithonimonas ginsengisoli TaxID=1245592 RepID=A0ABU4JIE6_9FLAO|nr:MULTISPECIES: DUF6088 family protein [Chryseobacterium group]MBV6878839.1 hypothetical protein [Epilithonimonas sp. FP105]MDW8549442.1 DUF6088 family protein [Epilithonimonas ginsengisoli]OAH71676.1 hypothetical protein AXA65_11950 [Chryseobacterium sp. FP211-J200]HBV17526.1 hypothetical protein [Chryseobacterium carnipullorum]
MKTSDIVKVKIDRLATGYIFTYKDFTLSVENKEAIIKALNRLVEKGKIKKISKGKFYKPESTVFGELLPDQYQIVKDLLEENNKITGYLTGYSIYNSLGLTTQVSNTIQIGKNNTRPFLRRERYIINFIKQPNIINNENIPYLQFLDCLKFIKKIPDTPIEKAIGRLLSIASDYKMKDIEQLVRLVQKYPPSTRSLLGALLDELQLENYSDSILKTLNPITKYKFMGIGNILKQSKKWNLI